MVKKNLPNGERVLICSVMRAGRDAGLKLLEARKNQLTETLQAPIMYKIGSKYVMGDCSMNVSITKIRDNLADALNRVAYGGERVILERRGKGVAVLVSMEDFQLLQELEDQSDIRAARRALKENGGVPIEEIKKRLGMK